MFSEGRAEFRRRDAASSVGLGVIDSTHVGYFETHTEIVVSPEDDIELRRTRITNRSRQRRVMEVTSYAEVVIASSASDALHPAFSNLFVQTEIIHERNAIPVSYTHLDVYKRQAKAAVARQIEYGEQRGVPWGVSESGYNTVDVHFNYQYRAFGVPGLGLKRGLAEDLVVAPYASVMALMVAPEEACPVSYTHLDVYKRQALCRRP